MLDRRTGLAATEFTHAKQLKSFIAMTLLATAMPFLSTAQAQPERDHQHHHYQLVQMPTLGGVETNFFDLTNNIAVLNNHGAVSGGAAETLIPDPNAPLYWLDPQGDINYAFQWQDGVFTSLGSLPGTNNSFSLWISENGTVAGASENGQIDPSVPELPEFSAVIWRDGKITNLGTLPQGGYQSAAVSVNSRGEAVGIATDLVPDANSLFSQNQNLWAIPYGYQLRAFYWDEKNGMQDLGTLGTGTDAQAVRINETGQVIGDSYTSSAPGVCYGVASGGFLWDHEHGMVDLGGFGGSCTFVTDLNNGGQVVGSATVGGDDYQRAFLWENGSLHHLGGSVGGHNTGAFAVNEDGKAVGFAYLAGETVYHATLWKHLGQLTDLGTVGGDLCAFAQGINSREQVVGDSLPTDCSGNGDSRAFLWENGSMVDLNNLIPPNSPLYLVYAYAINERGEIAVNGNPANGPEQAALLIPCDENHPGVDGCDYSRVDGTVARLIRPAPLRQQTQIVNPGNSIRPRLRQQIGPSQRIRRLAHAEPENEGGAKAALGSSCKSGNATSGYLLDDLKPQLAPAQTQGTRSTAYHCSSEVTSCRYQGDVCFLMHALERCWDLKYRRYCYRCAY